MEHAVKLPADRHVERRFERRRPLLRLVEPASPHSAAATRFAETCAAIGGTTMLHDLMPDVVTISFGAKTDAICQRLRKRGWDFVGTGDWQGERVLGLSFAGDRLANRTADDLVDALILVVGELEVAETRAW